MLSTGLRYEYIQEDVLETSGCLLLWPTQGNNVTCFGFTVNKINLMYLSGELSHLNIICYLGSVFIAINILSTGNCSPEMVISLMINYV